MSIYVCASTCQNLSFHVKRGLNTKTSWRPKDESLVNAAKGPRMKISPLSFSHSTEGIGEG